MNIENLKSAGINYEEGLERFSGSEHLYVKYLRKLLTIDSYQDMREWILKGELQEAFESAHKLKAFIGNLSIGTFYDSLRALTNDLRAGVQKDYRPELEAMDREYEIILQAIRGIDDV